MNNSTRLPYVEQLRANIQTVKNWKGKKPDTKLQTLIICLLKLIDKHSGKNGLAR